VWVLDDDAGTVSIIDVARGAVVGTVAGTPDPADLWIDDRRGLAYLVSGRDAVDVVAVSDGRIGTTIALPSGTRPCMIAPDPRAGSAHILGATGAVVTIDLADHHVLRSLDAGVPPSSATCAGPDKLYVTSYHHDLVTVLSRMGEPRAFTIPCGRGPTGAVLHAERAMLYTTNELDHTLTKIRVVDDTVVGTVKLDVDPFRVMPTQAITNRTELWVLGRGSGGLAGGIRVVDGIGGTVVRRVEGSMFPADWAFWNGFALVVSQDRELSVFDVDDGALLDEIRLTHDPDISGARSMSVSPTGTVFICNADATLPMCDTLR
jgi:DNA-binding beta-propeller fold protein YncE